MDKKQLRKNMISHLQNLPENKRKGIEDNLLSNLLSETIWKKAQTIGITISQQDEWETRNIIKAAWDQNKLVCVPKCYPDNKELVFFQLHSFDQLETVYYNLLEPNPQETSRIHKEKIDLLIVPGLVFDREGYRVGFGGGYYDRFLVDFPHTTVSLLSSNQLVDNVPTEQFDLPVQHLITNDGKVK